MKARGACVTCSAGAPLSGIRLADGCRVVARSASRYGVTAGFGLEPSGGHKGAPKVGVDGERWAYSCS